jgi:hypothetical protein
MPIGKLKNGVLVSHRKVRGRKGLDANQAHSNAKNAIAICLGFREMERNLTRALSSSFSRDNQL